MPLRDHRHPLIGAAQAFARTATGESAGFAVGGAFVLGVAVVLVVYPMRFMAGVAARFQSLALDANDAVEYRQAWRALAEYGEPWPSLWTNILNHPEGFPITILDGLPLAATVFRPLLPLLPEGFHYFGLWTALAVALQGVGAVVLMRAAGVRQATPCLGAAVLALTMPIFVGRLNLSHVALSSHFLLFFAVALSVCAARAKVRIAVVFPAALALTLAMLATHPYLGLQGLVLTGVAILTASGRLPLRLLALTVLGAASFGVCHALGLFAVTSWKNTFALGSFGFSFVGMILGEPESLRAVTGTHYSEQDAWLGWGCVLLLVAACAVRPLPRVRNGLFVWVVLALALAAISPWVRFGAKYLDLSHLVPDFVVALYATHRSTVRLAWPAVICLSFLPLAHIWRTWPRRRAAALLASAIALQLYAIHPYWAAEYRMARLPVPESPPMPDLDGVSRLLIARGADGRGMGLLHMRHAHQLALDSGIPLAGGRFARAPAANRQRRLDDLMAPKSSFRYLAPHDPSMRELPDKLPWIPHGLACERWEALLVCKPLLDEPFAGTNREQGEGGEGDLSSEPVRSLLI